MKKLFSIPLIALLMAGFLFPVAIVAENTPSYTVPMQKKPKKDSDHNESIDHEGRRTPPMPIYCVVSTTDGLNIVGLSEEIVTYEILEPSFDTVLVSYSEESGFLDFLFSQSGDFQIRLETENYYISGFISID